MERPLNYKKPFQFPVKKSGVYLNREQGRLEYWFALNGKKAKIGECRVDTSETAKKMWEEETNRQIKKMIIDKIGAKPLILRSHGLN